MIEHLLTDSADQQLNIGYLSYWSCACAFGALSVWLLLRSMRQKSRDTQVRLMIAASLCTTIWAVLLAQRSVTFIGPNVLWTAEFFRSVSWLGFLYTILNQHKLVSRYRYLNILLSSLCVLLMLHIWVVPQIWVDLPVNYWFEIQYAGLMLLAITGLVLVEQLFQNVRPEHRWWIKHLCVAIGCLFAFDFYLYADALLLGRLNLTTWDARGATYALLTPFLMIAAARNKDWSSSVQLSRNLVFHSTALLASGIYLLIMALVGHSILVFGGEWGSVVQIIFVVGAVLVLAILLLSGSIRSSVRVLFSKHFFNYAYDYREEWLRITALLSSGDSEHPSDLDLEQKAIFAMTQLVGSKGGSLWIRDHYGVYRWRAMYGNSQIELARIPPDNGLLEFMRANHWVINFEEMERVPEMYKGLRANDAEWAAGLNDIWLLVPLFHRDELYALIALTSPQVETYWNWEVIDLLRTAGQQIAGFLALEDAARELTVAKQFEGFNRLSAFLMHDLKNMIAQLSLVVNNAERHQDNPEFMRDAIQTVNHCVGKMNRLMMQLRQGTATGEHTLISLNSVLAEVMQLRQQHLPVPVFQANDQSIEVAADYDRLASVFEHVIQNAQDAAGKKGSVLVNMDVEAQQTVIGIQDDGPGMDKRFIHDNLFKPFSTTKGLTGMGIGAYESREYMLALGGDIEVESEPGVGTLFKLCIPHGNGKPQIAVSERENS